MVKSGKVYENEEHRWSDSTKRGCPTCGGIDPKSCLAFEPRVRRSVSLRLAERVAREFGLRGPVTLRRTYAGRWQRSSGAWVWRVVGHEIGSAAPMRECLMFPRWDLWSSDGGTEIIPVAA